MIPPFTLPYAWDRKTDITGWWVTDKLSGVRTWWDGSCFWNRFGKEYHTPQWFKDLMPKGVVLDGFLYGGPGTFRETFSALRKLHPVNKDWEKLMFMAFDLPEHKSPFEERNKAMLDMFHEHYPQYGYYSTTPKNPHIATFTYTSVASTRTVRTWDLALARKYGHEGILIRKPGSLYESGPSHSLFAIRASK